MTNWGLYLCLYGRAGACPRRRVRCKLTAGASPRPTLIKCILCVGNGLDRSAKLHQISRAIRESPLQPVGNNLSVVPQNNIKIHGRAWIFSENGHPFVRVRGHFPCQGNHPPLQRVVETPTPTHEIQFAPTNPNLYFTRRVLVRPMAHIRKRFIPKDRAFATRESRQMFPDLSKC